MILLGPSRVGTTHLAVGDWGRTFDNPVIAKAILDRLLNHSTTINIRGESYRLKDRRRAVLLGRPEGQSEAGTEALASPPVVPAA